EAALLYSLSLHDALPICSVVLPRNRRSQLHHLLRIEMFAQIGEQFIRKLDRCFRHRDGVAKYEPFQIGKRGTRFELGQVEKLLRSEEHTSELQSPDHLVC